MRTTSSSKGSGPACENKGKDHVLRVTPSLKDVKPEDWDACANPPGAVYHPFVSHAFLYALEESRSAVPKTGWAGQHLLLEDGAGGLAAAMPLYLKGHSQGEYIFDHGWAEAFERVGGHYYPKLLSAVPFTPATGRRLLVRDGVEHGEAEDILIAGALALAKRGGFSSIHVNFTTQEECSRLSRSEFLIRESQQFHWTNEGYGTFEDFLDALASRKRKQIRRERQKALENGVTIRLLTGRDITEAHWDAFFAFYMDTGNRKWGRPYLTRSFFNLVGARMSERILLILCERNGKPIAGALNFIGGDTLYGRYWGAVEDHPCLHFEACYYQAIDFAIAHKLSRVEAGAQGEHKIARGYRPVPTLSAHWIAEPAFRDAVARFLMAERRAVAEDIELLDAQTPFKKLPMEGDERD
jgi:predicted N-acyltransferase